MAVSHREIAIRTIQSVLAADMACAESDFLYDGVSFHKADGREGRFRFPIRERSLSIVTMGNGVVVTSNPERFEWMQQNLGHQERGQIFAFQTIAKLEAYVRKDNQFITGPDQKYVCSREDLMEFHITRGIKFSTYDRSKMNELYEHTGYRNALSYNNDSTRPDMLAAVAECNGEIAGIAGASADCEAMWQIGVDVLPEYQGLGIGRAVVGTLTRAVLNEGLLPYYSAEISNLRSQRLAISLGY